MYLLTDLILLVFDHRRMRAEKAIVKDDLGNQSLHDYNWKIKTTLARMSLQERVFTLKQTVWGLEFPTSEKTHY